MRLIKIFILVVLLNFFTLSFSNIIISKFDMPGTVLGLFLSSIIVLLVTFYSYKKNIE